MSRTTSIFDLNPLPSDIEIIDTLCAKGLNTFCLVADSIFSSIDQYIMDLEKKGIVNRWVVPAPEW